MERKHIIIIIVVASAIVLALVVGLVLYFVLRSDDGSGGSVLGVFDKAAVASNGPACADIGSDIMKKGGNAVEAAIAVLFCEGVVCCQSMGIGGGFLMTIYLRDQQKAISLTARETAPAEATEDMYGTDGNAMILGAKAGGIPGQLKGYQEVFDRYKSGNVEWKDLVYPTVKLCKEGFDIKGYLANCINNRLGDMSKYQQEFRDLLTNPETGNLYQQGESMIQPALGETLTQIAEKGVDVFYKGDLGEKFVEDLTELGGIITVEDLQNYEVRWEEPVSVKLSGNVTLYTAPLPGSGPIIAFMMNVLDGFIPASDKNATYQRITEVLKHGYGRRTQLGDSYENENISEIVQNLTSRSYAETIRSQISDDETYDDQEYYGAVLSRGETTGTAHVSVIGPNGDAVSVTSTINAIFGARVISKSTGIILNCEMGDFCAPGITSMFGIPASPANFIKPGRRPLSSMVPSIFVNNNGDVQLIVGSAGGSRITSTVTQVSLYNLWFDKNIKQALDQKRLHHQLFPMTLNVEHGFDTEVIESLEEIGHKVAKGSACTTVTGIEVRNGKIYASSDHRHKGGVAGF